MLCFWLMAICVNVQQGGFATIAPNYLRGRRLNEQSPRKRAFLLGAQSVVTYEAGFFLERGLA